MGFEALKTHTTGHSNVAIGQEALENNTTASNNTAVGTKSLRANTTGANNTSVGYGAGNNESARNVSDDVSTMFASYTAGPVSIGIQNTEVESDTANSDIERDAFGVSFAVNENFSVSYGQSDTEYDAQA